MQVAGITLTLAVQVLTAPPQASRPCEQATAAFATDAGTSDLCAGEEALAAATARTDTERRAQWRRAAERLRRAVNVANAAEVRSLALSLLVDTYDDRHLDEPKPMETALRDLIAVQPEEMAVVARLVRLLERQGLWESAEATLLDARQRQPESVAVYRQLAQFYARRVTALTRAPTWAEVKAENGPGGEPDANGVYRVGGSMSPPARLDVPQYPPEAKAAEIAGTVIAELVIDATGQVTDATIVRSIPLLDEAALAAVRHWRFAPSVVNGVAVPVRMNVNVNFALPRPSPPPR